MITYLVVGVSILIIINFIMLCYLAGFMDKFKDVDLLDMFYKIKSIDRDTDRIEAKLYTIGNDTFGYTSEYIVDELPGMFDKVDTVSISTGKYLELIKKEQTLKDLEYKLKNGN